MQWPFTLCSVKTYQGRFGVHVDSFQEIHPHPRITYGAGSSPLPSRERERSRFPLGFAKVSWGRRLGRVDRAQVKLGNHLSFDRAR